MIEDLEERAERLVEVGKRSDEWFDGILALIREGQYRNVEKRIVEAENGE